MRTFKSRLLAVASATTLLATGASAQTIFSTFGPGSTYLPVELTIFTLPGISSWSASSFVYGGPSGALLSGVRVAAEDQYPPGDASLFVGFLHGSTIQTASLLEGWTVPSNSLPDQIYSLSSLDTPALISGDTYWVEFSSSYYAWGSNYSNVGDLGITQSDDAGSTWTPYCTVCTAPAFDVSASAGAVTPEPGTMTLLASGLVAMTMVGRRRKQALRRA